MPRRKPASSKQRKAELQLKRAIKRGDIPAQPSQSKISHGKKARRNPLDGTSVMKASELSSKRLQSAFLKVEPEILERSRITACNVPLQRPLPADVAILSEKEVGLCAEDARLLKCPTRPKWRFDMTKKEVEKNEEAMFQKWTADVDCYIKAWRASRSERPGSSGVSLKTAQAADEGKDALSAVLLSPTYYERNLEVWRQFWRVSEISQIILLLLDSRCPALHFPPSLHNFLTSLRPVRPIIIVLTKSDLVPVSLTAAWSAWLRHRYPSTRIVTVQSYREQDAQEERKGQGQRKRFYPEMKQDDLDNLVHALKAAHAELLLPPVKVQKDAENSERWKPNIRQTVDWEAALRGGRAQVDQIVGDLAQECITIGLIGQPNVGKSSLLNALFGTHKVKASRTPGKTKHFQTLFWTPDIRLVDCPGLVLPNFVHMELQVLSGILPISQIPSIPACIYYASRLLPLEEILRLTHPDHTGDTPEDKRTWRENRPPQQVTETNSQVWTAMDILTAYAIEKGWVTAKAGRPDANRAGNALLRTLAEGKIRWAFQPPNIACLGDYVQRQESSGIWLGDAMKDDADERWDCDTESCEDCTTEGGTSHDESSGSEKENANEGGIGTLGVGRFGALILEEVSEPEDETG